MADHLIEMYDTGRSQWLWRCVKCKLEHPSAITLTRLTCIPNDPGIDYRAAPDLLAACIALAVDHAGADMPGIPPRYLRLALAAIANAKGVQES